MKRNQVNDLFDTDTKRQRIIIINIIVISIIFVLALVFLCIYVDRRKVEYVKYNENSSATYKVHLKENLYYKDKVVDANNQYISELIDYINANFKHNITLEKDNMEYTYSYYIKARAVVNDGITHKKIYEYNDDLVAKKEVTTKNANSVIDASVNIDYNKYNQLISKFVQTYSLVETENVLKVSLYVDMFGSCDEEDNETNETVTTLEIPLTRRTISIDSISNIVDDDENVMLCIKPSKMNILYLLLSICSAAICVFLIVRLIKYVINTRSAQTVYDKELKRILSNYRSYIQKVNSRFDYTGYQTLKVDNFTDMLEIRDTTNQPILMIENDDKDSVYFVIPTSTKILYIYCIRVSDIEKEMKDKDN